MNRDEFITIINKVIELIDYEVWEDIHVHDKEEDYEIYLDSFNIFITDARLTDEQLFNKYFNKN